MHDGSLQTNIFNIKNDKLANAGGIIGRIEGGGKEERVVRGRGRRHRREGKGKIGRGITMCLHTYSSKGISPIHLVGFMDYF